MADIVTMPKLGFDMAEGTLVRWAKAEGEPVEKGELLAEIETDKATVEVESTYSGVVHRHIVGEGAIVPVGDPIAVIGEEGEQIDVEALVGALPAGQGAEAAPEAPEPTAAQPGPPPEAPVVEAPSPDGGRLPDGVRASPVARRLAEQEGIDLGTVPGSGPGGRIVKSDVEAYLEQRAAAPEPAPGAPSLAPLPSLVAADRPDRQIPLTRLRSLIGRRMVESRQQVPHFYVTHDYDLGPVMALRKQLNALLEPEGIKLSVNDFLIKAAALALLEFPNLNASLDGDRVVQHGAIHIGNAVAVESGLLTVVCRDAAFKPLRQISVEIREMATRAREGKVRPEDIEGSTFTISNLGMFDVEAFVAIINPPEAAILAVGSGRQVPVVVDGEIQAGWRMKATISVDHRVSDGAEAARFLQGLARYLEEPLRLMV